MYKNNTYGKFKPNLKCWQVFHKTWNTLYEIFDNTNIIIMHIILNVVTILEIWVIFSAKQVISYYVQNTYWLSLDLQVMQLWYSVI